MPEHEATVAGISLLTPGFFVSLAMAALLFIMWRKNVLTLLVSGLDQQIAAIRTRLEEAGSLRKEAEALRDEYAKKLAGAEQQAATMITHAEAEAKVIVARAESEVAELIRRRSKMAEDKIAAAERVALDAVQAKAADAATRAAAALIAERHDAVNDKPLVDRTIAELGRLH